MTERLIALSILLAACGTDPIEAPPASAADRRVDAPVAHQPETTHDAAPAADLTEVVARDTGGTVEAAHAAAPEPHAVPEVARYRLRRGETPAHFARWSGLPVEVVAEVSGLALDGTYPVGTEVSVPVAGERRGQLEAAREAHHTRRAEGYLASRGGAVGTEFHTVRTGDTAWSISLDRHGIPVWLLETYNPSVDLERLRPGQELMVPVLADVVVDAGAE